MESKPNNTAARDRVEPHRWLQMKAAAHYCDMRPSYFYKLQTLGLGPRTIGNGRGKRSFTAWLDEWLRVRGGEGQ